MEFLTALKDSWVEGEARVYTIGGAPLPRHGSRWQGTVLRVYADSCGLQPIVSDGDIFDISY